MCVAAAIDNEVRRSGKIPKSGLPSGISPVREGGAGGTEDGTLIPMLSDGWDGAREAAVLCCGVMWCVVLKILQGGDCASHRRLLVWAYIPVGMHCALESRAVTRESYVCNCFPHTRWVGTLEFPVKSWAAIGWRTIPPSATTNHN
jgi:hypothetical protein